MTFRFRYRDGRFVEELVSARRMHLDDAARWFATQLTSVRLTELLVLVQADEVEMVACAFGIQNIPFEQTSTARLLELALRNLQPAA